MTENAKITGLNIRQEANSRSAKLGLLPRGARVELGERSRDGKWGKIQRVVSGQIAPVKQGGVVDPAAATGWVFIGELDPGPVAPKSFDQVVALDPPVAIKAGDLVGHVGEYQQYVDALATPVRGRRPLLHLEVFTGDDLPAFIEKCRAYARTLPAGSGNLFVIEKGALLVQPAQPDGQLAAGEQVTPVGGASESAWVKVQRGTPTVVPRTTLGKYNTATRTYEGGKIFTGWFVGARDDQRTQDEATATRLGYARREVLVATGQPVWVERAALTARASAPGGAALSTWSAFPLRVANAGGTPAGLTRVIPRAELERSPATNRVTDPDNHRWWKVLVRRPVNDPEGRNAIVGWACETGHAKVSWQSPWAWPGFEHVDEGEIQPVDMWSTVLYRTGMANSEELTDFKARADKVDASALLKKLYELIDTNSNGIFELRELRAAVAQPLLAQALSRVIPRYESEWGGEDAKWDELDPLVLDGTPEWSAEKQRIKGMRWWPQAAAAVKNFPASPVAYHIHPIALIENFHTQTAAAAATNNGSGGPPEKSGRQWVSRFMPSSRIADLKEPFKSNVTRFFQALNNAGISTNINTTLRPPQRSYLMYYAREIKNGLSPDQVPAFVPQDGDEPVNIDWAHRDSSGKADLDAARRAAREMDAAYGAAGAIGRAYRSNHNKGQAIDVSFSPAWGVGKTVVDASGKSVAIGSRRDLIDVGATYSVYHWTYHGAKAKNDDPHWSLTGN